MNNLPAETRLLIDLHVKYIQELDTVRVPSIMRMPIELKLEPFSFFAFRKPMTTNTGSQSIFA